MSFFSKSGSKKKDLLRQIEQLKAQVDLMKKKNQKLEQGYFDQFDRNASGVSISDFYDGVIDIPSLRSLPKGWDVHVNNEEEYRSLVQKKGIIVSVVGNYGKGKTFLLGLLSDEHTPHGFNVNTQGISIKYLRDKSNLSKIRPVIVLDTKGGSLPLDVSENVDTNTRETRAENSIEGQVEKENKYKQILRDHDATEDVLQNYIMEEANVILIVVSDLTFPDQRLITKITSKFKENESKKIIVVHNLYHAKSRQDVENKLKEFIFLSFNLTATEFTEFHPDRNSWYYVDKGIKNNALIHHVILAKHNSEAGNYYNDVAIKHIKACIDANGHSKSIDIIESFHRYLQMTLPSYIKTQPELDTKDIILEKAKSEASKRLQMKIIMTEKQTLEVKAVMTDELGQLRIFKDSNEFQPRYCLFEEARSDSERYLCMKVECPDRLSIGLSDIQHRVRHNTDEFSIQIKGLKQIDNRTVNKKLHDIRETGQFFVETEMHRKSKYRFDYDGIIEQPQRTYVDGMVILRWKLRPLNEDPSETRETEPSTPPTSSILKPFMI